MNIKSIVGPAKLYIARHAPAILTGMGIAGMVMSVIFSVKATPKAVEAIEEKKKELGKEKLTVGETIQTTWKYYLPTAITMVGSAACVLGSNSVSSRRSAAFAACCTLSETAFQEYQDKVKEVVGERKENDIRADIASDRIAADPPKTSEIVFVGDGSQLFQEEITRRYFRSDIEKVRRAELELCRMMKDDMDGYISVNDVQLMLGLPESGRVNDDLGWFMDNGYIKFKYDYVPVGNEVCTIISYGTDPHSRYSH